jgi:hypothetical protein
VTALLLALLAQNFADKKLADVPDDLVATWGDVSWSPDGKSVAYLARKGGKQLVVHGSTRGEEFDAIELPLAWSSGGRLAYVAVLGPKKFVVSGKDRLEEADDVKHLQFAGGKPAYVVKREGRWTLVVGETRTELADAAGDLLASPDGRRIAYTTRTGVVVDGTEQGPYASARHLAWSADSTTLAFAAKKDMDWVVMIGDRKALSVVHEELAHPSISPDKKSFAFCGRKERSWSVVAFEKNGGMLDMVFGSNEYGPALRGAPVWSPDSSQVAYVARQGSSWFVCWGNRKGMDGDWLSDSFEGARSPAFSPDSRRVAFAALRGGKWQAVVPYAKASEPYAAMGAPSWSKDGKKLAFGAAVAGGKKVELWWRTHTLE